MLQQFILIYKEFIFFTNTDVYKFLIWAPSYVRPKSIKQRQWLALSI